MKAIVIAGPGDVSVLRYIDIPTPVPGPGELLVRVAATAVGYGDTRQRAGGYPYALPPPVIPGYQASGVVVGIGANVSRSWIGRRVAVMGPRTNAEYVACDGRMAAEIPDDVADDQATLVPNFYLTAYYLVHLATKVRPGQTVAIHAAAGGIGTALVQLCRLAGARTIAMAGSRDKCDFALRQGADHAIDYSREQTAATLRHLTDGRGVDLIFNSTCGATVAEDLGALAPYGELVVYGIADGFPRLDIVETMFAHLETSPTLRVFNVFTVMKHQPARITEDLGKLLAMVAGKQLSPQIFRTLPLAQIGDAHKLMEERKIMGTIVLRPDGDPT